MGTWGTGYFEDDTSLDFMADLEESADPKQLIRDAFERAQGGDYLDMDDACAAIVSATYVDAQLHNTQFSESDDQDPLPVDTFRERHPEIDLTDLKTAASQALRRVLGESSELAELWEESGEDEAWRSGIEELATRLEQ